MAIYPPSVSRSAAERTGLTAPLSSPRRSAPETSCVLKIDVRVVLLRTGRQVPPAQWLPYVYRYPRHIDRFYMRRTNTSHIKSMLCILYNNTKEGYLYWLLHPILILIDAQATTDTRFSGITNRPTQNSCSPKRSLLTWNTSLSVWLLHGSDKVAYGTSCRLCLW